jgi:hypothetical protein
MGFGFGFGSDFGFGFGSDFGFGFGFSFNGLAADHPCRRRRHHRRHPWA